MKLRTWITMGFGAAIGAGATYLLDPEHGAERRREAAVRLRARARDCFGQVTQDLPGRLRRYADQARGGFAEAVGSVRSRPAADDATLVQKVSSEALGPSEVPAGTISIDAADGVVTLRGHVPVDRQARELEEAVRRVHGVRDVVNLLSVPRS